MRNLESGSPIFTNPTNIRIWLVSYSSHAAAVAAGDYNTTISKIFGPSTCLNFPDSIGDDDALHGLSPASIRKKATNVEAKVDAL
ncbi:hypothetical protein L2E82_50028 [Cichorium intybus]|nr:hypothetical protein L2E82_50028 [Cichorium intybus]